MLGKSFSTNLKHYLKINYNNKKNLKYNWGRQLLKMQAPASCSALNAARSEYSIHTTLKPAQDLQLESVALPCFFDKWQWTLCASRRLIQVALSQKSLFKQPHGFQEIPHKMPSVHILGLLRKRPSGLSTFPLPPHVGFREAGNKGLLFHSLQHSDLCNLL